MSDNDLLPPENASAVLGDVPASTMAWWRSTGRGPKYIKIGRKVVYRRSDLDAFIKAGERQPEAA